MRNFRIQGTLIGVKKFYPRSLSVILLWVIATLSHTQPAAILQESLLRLQRGRTMRLSRKPLKP